jgi:hypothetical protein
VKPLGYNSIAISHLSLQYLGVPVTAVTLNGVPYNPTADLVQMAFLPQATQSPQPTDWQIATWGTNTSNVLQPYTAFCLIGPGGTIQLGTGTYVIWVRIVDNPEVPVLTAPMQLEVT